MADVGNTSLSKGRGGSRLFTGLLVVACAGLSLEVVLLARTNRELRNQLAAERAKPTDWQVQPRERFDSFSLIDQIGSTIEVTFGVGKPASILLFFADGCEACERIYPTWMELFAEPGSGAARVFAIQVDEPGNAAVAHNTLALPVFKVPEHDFSAIQKVLSVPATLIVDAEGVVQRVWRGDLSDAAIGELQTVWTTGLSP